MKNQLNEKLDKHGYSLPPDTRVKVTAAEYICHRNGNTCFIPRGAADKNVIRAALLQLRGH